MGPMILHPLFFISSDAAWFIPHQMRPYRVGRLSDALSLGRLLSLLRSFCLSFLSKRLLSFWFSFWVLSSCLSMCPCGVLLLFGAFLTFLFGVFFFGLRCAPIFTLLHGGGTIGIKGSSFGCLHHASTHGYGHAHDQEGSYILETVFFTCIISMIGTSLCGDDCMTPCCATSIGTLHESHMKIWRIFFFSSQGERGASFFSFLNTIQ